MFQINYYVKANGLIFLEGTIKGLRWSLLKTALASQLKIPMAYTCFYEILAIRRRIILWRGEFTVTVNPPVRQDRTK